MHRPNLVSRPIVGHDGGCQQTTDDWQSNICDAQIEDTNCPQPPTFDFQKWGHFFFFNRKYINFYLQIENLKISLTLYIYPSLCMLVKLRKFWSKKNKKKGHGFKHINFFSECNVSICLFRFGMLLLFLLSSVNPSKLKLVNKNDVYRTIAVKLYKISSYIYI